jgi:hypothetical protein
MDNRPVMAGFTKSSTTASASWRGVTVSVAGSSPGVATVARFPLAAAAMTVAPTLAMLRQCCTTAQRSFFVEMVTLAGLEPATSPAPGENKDALSPLELQRRYNPHDRLWRRKGR